MKTAKKKSKKKWIKPRHKVVVAILRWPVYLYCRLKYGIKIQRFKQRGQYLILYNHQTAFDQFFVGIAFRDPLYYLASEDLFSNGWVSSLIKYLVEPIPIKKQSTDVRAILNCIKVAKEGGSIAIAPEGNRTYSGKTEYMSSSIVPLARKLGLPIALYRIEGGYGVHPRWSDVVRRGKMKGYVSRVIDPEEYAVMSDDQLMAEIERELYVNEAVADGEFRHKKAAEYLERAIYVCPKCGFAEHESHDDVIKCKKCGLSARYTPTKELEGLDGEFPFRFISQWYDYQSDFVNSLDTADYSDAPLFSDTAALRDVIPYEEKRLVDENAKLELYGDKMIVRTADTTMTLDFDHVSAAAVLGRNKLNIYYEDKIYQFKGSKRFNALKYVHIYHRHKNICKGEQNVKFLGL